MLFELEKYLLVITKLRSFPAQLISQRDFLRQRWSVVPAEPEPRRGLSPSGAGRAGMASSSRSRQALEQSHKNPIFPCKCWRSQASMPHDHQLLVPCPGPHRQDHAVSGVPFGPEGPQVSINPVLGRRRCPTPAREVFVPAGPRQGSATLSVSP